MSTIITGPPGCGKTTELLRLAAEAVREGAVLLTSCSAASRDNLRRRSDAPGIAVRALDDLAFEVLTGGELIDDVAAAALFEEAAQPLFHMSWAEFMEAELDPEVPGLRAPERFLDAAFRLVCKLRDAGIAPEQFLESSMRGAAQFYAKPPNLAHPDLLYYTKDSHRDSLEADAAELQRQYRREVDLARILAKLYRAYLDHPVRRGCLTARDAIADAAQGDALYAPRRAALLARYPYAFVDDAEELTLGDLQFLQSLYGEALENVTLAGDKEAAISTFRGARPDRVFALAGTREAVTEQRRSPFTLDVACRHLLGTPGSPLVSTQTEVGLTLFRASTQRAEAQFVAEHVTGLLNSGCSHDEIALVFRSVATVRPYRDALLARGVRVQVAGDLNIFTEPEALDALAILWFAHDPYRHEYLLRVLSGPALSLSDATLVLLCNDAPDTQTPLFTDVGLPEPERPSGWDPKRDIRLGWNVLRGDRDGDLQTVARERVQSLRQKRAGWVELATKASVPDLVRRIWAEGLARAGAPGSANASYQQLTLARLFDRIVDFTRRRPDASLGEFLEDTQERMNSAFESCETSEVNGAVRLLTVDTARGREFDHVVIPNARAGSFPRWYVPDAFLYSPSQGMIAKENVGDARTARTAKFTYYMFRTKAREAFNLQERRAFVYALRRAKRTALVTACERATRGVSAPEFLSELQAARLPGAIDVSDRWRPASTQYAG